MEEKKYYVVKTKKGNNDWKFLETIYQTSVSEDESIDDAMKFYDDETAKIFGKYIERRNGYEWKVIKVETTMEEVIYE